MKPSPTFPSRLIWWRKKRGLSQLELAIAAGCSQRHVSFLELGRTKPSREMVLRLSTALDVPLRNSNELLLAAGYAPEWTETNLGAEMLAPIRNALNFILTQQEPFPAVVVDRRWNAPRVPRRSTEAKRCSQPRRCSGCARCPQSPSCKLGRCCSVFLANRGG
jgi:transcriptional regulator with XRE-family HTH domain